MVLSGTRQRDWLVAAFVSANLLFALVLSAALWNSRQQEAELHLRTGQNLSMAIERSVSGTFDKIDLALQEISDSIEKDLSRGQIDRAAIEKEIVELGQRIPEIEVMDYADAKGKVPANSGYPRGNNAISIADRDYFLTLKTTPTAGMVSSKPVLGRTSNKWVIVFARRIAQRDGRFVGVVYASVSLRHFTDSFSELKIGPQGIVAILDPSYAIIARYPTPPDPNLLGKPIPQEWLIDLLKSDQRTFTRQIRTHVDGIERNYSFHRLSTRPYHVAVGLSSEDVFAGWWRQVALAAAVFLSFLLLSAFGSWQVLRSWQHQHETNDALSREKERYRLLNQELEARVEQRTADVLNANRELRQALDHLGHSEKLAALGSVVAGVAHELNTPIGNMRLAASTYKEKLAELLAEFAAGNLRRSSLQRFMADAEEFVRLLDRSSERASEMISSFKTVAVDQSSNRRRVFDLRQAIDELLTTMQPKLRRQHCTVDHTIPPGIMIDSYPGALTQIVGNLIDNALLHAFEGRDGGKVGIELEHIADDEVLIRFTDDGKGIPPEEAERIFEPFYSTKVGAGGSGLGLHLVRQMAARPLGGSLTLQAGSTAGASFVLRLPRRAPDEEAEPA